MGKEQWEDGSCYEGGYQLGYKHGSGYFKWGDGTTYKGSFVNNALEGVGVYN
jgi:hypothetical protein